MHTRTHLPDYQPFGGRRPPDELVRNLREIDPTAEIIYAGVGHWLLGRYRPNRVVEEKGIRMIKAIRKMERIVSATAHPDIRTVRKVLAFRRWTYELFRMGFRKTAKYKRHGEPGSDIVEDFRARIYNLQRIDRIEQELLDQADADVQLLRTLEQAEADAREKAKDAHRHAFRKPLHSIPSTVRHRRRVG